MLSSTFVFLFLSITLNIVIYFKHRKHKRKIHNKRADISKAYNVFRSIINVKNSIDFSDVSNDLNQYNFIEKFKKSEILDLLFELTKDLKSYNQSNLDHIIDYYNGKAYLEKELKKANLKNKIIAMQFVLELRVNIAESVISAFLYHKKSDLRKLARLTYIFISNHDPFRFFDEEFDKNFTELDKIKIHNILQRRKDKIQPNYAQWIERTKNINLKCFLVYEIGYYKQQENINYLKKLLTETAESKLKKEIILTLAKLNSSQMEEELVDNFNHGNIEVKQSVIENINIKHTTKTIGFLKESYYRAYNTELKINIGRAIFKSGLQGIKIFEEMENKAETEFEKLIFKHIRNPLIE